ncbi:MAG: murein hydrolase activator EnvC family protein [Burkholderiales bacterium]
MISRCKAKQTRVFWGDLAWKRPLLLGFGILALVVLTPASASANDDKKQALDDLRSRIERLNRQVAKGEESRSEATDQLKVSEKAISDVNRNLTGLARDRVATSRELADVTQRIKATKNDIQREEALRDKLIRHQYMFGNTDAIRLVLTGKDVSTVERQLGYLRYVTRSRVATISRLKTHVAQLAALEMQAREKQTQLAANADEQKKARARLVSERMARQQVLGRIRADIAKNRREVGRLKRDENRLTKLIEQIAIELARKAESRDSRRGDAKKQVEQVARGRKPGEAVNDVVDAGFVGRAFSSLRGKLKLPVKGELTGKFGAQREDGGLTWKGLFIRAEEGQPVKAVADGRVVYADWLRGYGNLVIVDHGSGFLSLYGHNESIVKQVGENTVAGEAIASVGSTGGALDSGVYFELRQDGKPFDPMRWVGR